MTALTEGAGDARAGTRRRTLALLVAAMAGAALLAIPSRFYRIDQVSCATWPSTGVNLLLSGVHVVAVALLTVAWLGFSGERAPPLSPRRTLLAGVAVHGAALLALPYQSQDPLFYAAIGRVMAAFHASPYVALDRTLSQSDPFLARLPLAWQHGTSAYWPGFHAIADVVGHLAGDHLTRALRLYQLVGLCAMVGTAALAGLAAGDDAAQRGADRARIAARATALVIFCPLAIIEGTQSAHNDGLLALATALFALLVVRGRGLAALAALLAAVSVKASGVLLAGIDGVHLVLSRVRLDARRLVAVGLGLAVAASLLAPHLVGWLSSFTALFGRPDAPFYCVRAIECIPRGLLFYAYHRPRAAWGVGLAFRALGGLWLIYAALRAAREPRPLAWCATGFFVYFLYLHGWMQSWYLLPLLPLMPFADPRVLPSMKAAAVCGVLYYAVRLCTACIPRTGRTSLAVTGGSILESLIVLAIPGAFLLWGLWKGRAAVR